MVVDQDGKTYMVVLKSSRLLEHSSEAYEGGIFDKTPLRSW